MLKTSLLPPAHTLISVRARHGRNATSLRKFRDRVNAPGIGSHILLLKYQHQAHLIKINRILLHVDHLLAKGKWENAWEYFYSKLSPGHEAQVEGDRPKRGMDDGLTTSNDRFEAYEHAVSLFASYHRFPEAIEIHGRMVDEGFVPSLSVRAKIMAYSLVRDGSSADAVLGALEQAVFAEPEYNEKALFQLIRFLGDTMSFSPSSIDQMVESWSRHHGQVSFTKTLKYLVHLHAGKGLPQDVEKWLQVHVNQAVKKGKAPDPAPYTGFLSALIHAPVENIAEALSKSIIRMQNDGVTPDLALFNALISNQAARCRLREAFETYDLLYQSKGRDLTPDAFTFSTLFKAVGGVQQRSFAAGKSKYTPNLRDLYYNLLECHLIRTKGNMSRQSPALDSSVLNLALRSFMSCNDYPGAYVVLRSFEQCKISANLVTGRTVVKSLLWRVRKESRLYSGRISRAWSGKFLGGYQCRGDVHENVFGISNEEIIGRVLSHQNKTTTPDSPIFAGSGLLRSAAMSSTVDHWSAISHTDLVSLKRIVKHAFLSDSENPHRLACKDLGPTQAFSSAIVNAKSLMIPDCAKFKRYFAFAAAGENTLPPSPP